jgi:hypothetical protein
VTNASGAATTPRHVDATSNQSLNGTNKTSCATSNGTNRTNGSEIGCNTTTAEGEISYTCSVQRIQAPKPPRAIAIKAW